MKEHEQMRSAKQWDLRVSSRNIKSVIVKWGQYLSTAFTDITILKERMFLTILWSQKGLFTTIRNKTDSGLRAEALQYLNYSFIIFIVFSLIMR